MRLIGKIEPRKHLPDTAEGYYKLALETSRSASYYHTIIPALYEYGSYLYTTNRTGDNDKDASGLKKINEAMNLAKEKKMSGEIKKIKTLCDSLKIEL